MVIHRFMYSVFIIAIVYILKTNYVHVFFNVQIATKVTKHITDLVVVVTPLLNETTQCMVKLEHLVRHNIAV